MTSQKPEELGRGTAPTKPLCTRKSFGCERGSPAGPADQRRSARQARETRCPAFIPQAQASERMLDDTDPPPPSSPSWPPANSFSKVEQALKSLRQRSPQGLVPRRRCPPRPQRPAAGLLPRLARLQAARKRRFRQTLVNMSTCEAAR